MSYWFHSAMVELAVSEMIGPRIWSHWLSRLAEESSYHVVPWAPPPLEERLKVPSIVCQPSVPDSKVKVLEAKNWKSLSVVWTSKLADLFTVSSSAVTSTRKVKVSPVDRPPAMKLKLPEAEPP